MTTHEMGIWAGLTIRFTLFLFAVSACITAMLSGSFWIALGSFGGLIVILIDKACFLCQLFLPRQVIRQLEARIERMNEE